MNGIISQIAFYLSKLRFWFTVNPWETAIRVRLGRNVIKYGPGVHFKIPALDRVFIASDRTHVTNLPNQTVTTTCGRVVTVSAVVTYRIVDIDKLYSTLFNVTDWIINESLSCIAKHLLSVRFDQIVWNNISDDIMKLMPSTDKYGVIVEKIQMTDAAVTKAFRFISDSGGNQWWTQKLDSLINPNDSLTPVG